MSTALERARAKAAASIANRSHARAAQLRYSPEQATGTGIGRSGAGVSTISRKPVYVPPSPPPSPPSPPSPPPQPVTTRRTAVPARTTEKPSRAAAGEMVSPSWSDASPEPVAGAVRRTTVQRAGSPEPEASVAKPKPKPAVSRASSARPPKKSGSSSWLLTVISIALIAVIGSGLWKLRSQSELDAAMQVVQKYACMDVGKQKMNEAYSFRYAVEGPLPITAVERLISEALPSASSKAVQDYATIVYQSAKETGPLFMYELDGKAGIWCHPMYREFPTAAKLYLLLIGLASIFLLVAFLYIRQSSNARNLSSKAKEVLRELVNRSDPKPLAAGVGVRVDDLRTTADNAEWEAIAAAVLKKYGNVMEESMNNDELHWKLTKPTADVQRLYLQEQ